MLHNAVVLYRRIITFKYIVSTNHKSPRLRIPTEGGVKVRREVEHGCDMYAEVDKRVPRARHQERVQGPLDDSGDVNLGVRSTNTTRGSQSSY